MRTQLLILMLGGCLLAASSSEAQTPQAILDLDGNGVSVAIMPTARQVQALLAALKHFNATSRRDEPPFTLDEWVRSWIVDRAEQYLHELRETERRSACQTFLVKSATEQQTILQAFGGLSPCVP